MPLSGTTLGEQVPARHPEVHGAGEVADVIRTLLQVTNTKLLDEAFRVLLDNQTELIPLLNSKYLAKLDAYAPDAQFISDKMLKIFLYMGEIQWHFLLQK